MKSILFFALALLVVYKLSAQSVKFDKQLLDMGLIREEAGRATAKFILKNKSRDTLLISEIRSGCICIDAEWQKQTPVAPGSKMEIILGFLPENRVGDFRHSAVVSLKKWPDDVLLAPEIQIIEITGKVLPRPIEIVKAFPIKMGNLRFTSNYFSFDTLMTNQTREISFLIFNEGTKPVNILKFDVAEYIQVKPGSLQIKAQDSARVFVTLDGKTAQDWASVYYTLRIVSDDSLNDDTFVTLYGFRGEDYSALGTEELINSPKAVFETRAFNFGKIVQGASVEHEFIIKNEGNEELVIRKWKPGCGCTSSQPDKMILMPGESTSAKAIFNSTGQSGNIHKAITVVTNDPVEPVVILYISGDVALPEGPLSPGEK